MKYYSTNGKASPASLEQAVVRGLAEDRGLYMPERIAVLPASFFDNIQTMTFQEIACTVADAFFGEDIPAAELHRIVEETLAFDCPVVPVTRSIGALEQLRLGKIQMRRSPGGAEMSRSVGSQRE